MLSIRQSKCLLIVSRLTSQIASQDEYSHLYYSAIKKVRSVFL